MERSGRAPGPRYRWVALSNTTLGVFLATVNSSIILISLPAIFRGIHVDPVAPGEAAILLWLVIGYQIVMASLTVTLGRVSDMVGRVRMYNLGFAVFTVGSILLTVAPGSGNVAAIRLIVYRMVQGLGGALLFSNSAAILTDAFPSTQRGAALGLNQASAFAGQISGLVLGGVLSTIDYRLVFVVSVVIGVVGTVWAYVALREVVTVRRGQQVDWPGNLTFGVALALILIGANYGQQPYGGSVMGWTNPSVIASLALGVILLVIFVGIELRLREPMFRLSLFRIRMFAAANLAGFLAAMGRGGLQLMLIIWLQGIWLPLHGYSYESTPLWAGIYLLPLVAGVIFMGPIAGTLSDRFGARGFATGGMLLAALGFGALAMLPANFSYAVFAPLIFAMGAAQGLFASPNSAAIMNSLPAAHRGGGSGMRTTLQVSGMVVSQALFFTLVIIGISRQLPESLRSGLMANGVPQAAAAQVAQLPPTAALFAAFLGFNPMARLLPPSALQGVPPASQAVIYGSHFFPSLISPPFISGLHLAFAFGAGLSLLAAIASLLRGGRYYVKEEEPASESAGEPQLAV